MDTLLNLLVCLIIPRLCTSGGDTSEEIFIIPEGFQGPVAIVFEHPMGDKLLHEGNDRVYEIPPDGLLLTHEKSNFGTGLGYSYFYLDQEDFRVPLQLGFNSLSEEELREVRVWGRSTGRIGLEPPCEFSYYSFTIGAVERSERVDNSDNPSMRDRLGSLMRECRMNIDPSN